MMKINRQRWFVLNHDLPFKESIAEFSFSKESGIGFEVIEAKAGLVRARFIERIEVIEEASSPYGELERVSVTRYVHFEFAVTKISSEVSLIKVINPPASLRAFVGMLMESLQFRASLTKVDFDLCAVYRSIAEDESIDRLMVNKVTVSQVPLGRHATSKIEVVSTENALAEFLDNYTAPTMKVEKLSISLRVGHESEVLELTSAGSIRCTPGVEFFLEKEVSIT